MNREWLSLHIFYASNSNPLLSDCVAPLVEKLRERGLVSRYFFIRYWLGGPHVRLRLSPAEGAPEGEIKELLERDVRAFLTRRPAFFELNRDTLGPLYRKMYEAEYGAEKFVATYGDDGEIPFYANNSYHYIEYEREFGRYGGPCGLELSEHHFEFSSDTVLQLVRETNMHVRSITMGHAVQLMLQTCYGFFGDDEQVSAFLRRYIEFWQRTYNENGERLYSGFDRKYERMAAGIRERIEEARRSVRDGVPATAGTRVEMKWAAHVKELREELLRLLAAGRLELPGGMGDETAAFSYLLSSYIHMTNNRLGISILDETYLSYLLVRAIDSQHEGRELKEAVGG
jgi:thiopeptide-type bacteriocin biosynthesis protein